jgi:hypothetical protein
MTIRHQTKFISVGNYTNVFVTEAFWEKFFGRNVFFYLFIWLRNCKFY